MSPERRPNLETADIYQSFLPEIIEMICRAVENEDLVLAAKLQECLDHINEILM